MPDTSYYDNPVTEDSGAAASISQAAPTDADLMCPYMMGKGRCPYEDTCTYLHGQVCEMCGMNVLNPNDKEQRDEHMKVGHT